MVTENEILNKFKEIEKNESLYYSLKNDFESEISQKYGYFERAFYNDSYPKYHESLKQAFFKECLTFLNGLVD